MFGPERVWTYRARSHLGRNKQYRGLTAFFLALTLASAGWFAWGIVRQEPGWIVGGVAGVFFGVMLTLVYWLAGRQSLASVRKWRQAGLVIAPDGLALVQGDLVGELSWDEVREVKLGKAESAFWITALGSPWLSYEVTTSGQQNKGLVLKVEGAVIVIADIYDRPLSLLYQHIRYHWRGETAGEGWKSESMSPASGAGVVPADSGDVPPLSSEGIVGHG